MKPVSGNTRTCSRSGTSGCGGAAIASSPSLSSATTSRTVTLPGRPPPSAARPDRASTSVAAACSTCAARCCYEYTVTVTGHDVWVIATGLGLAPQQFLVHHPTRAGSAAGFRLDQGDARFDLALDKAAVDRPHRPCVFLVELPGGGGRCGIHAHRPLVCQTYPASADGDVVALRDDALCPTGAWKLSQMRLAAWRRRIMDFTVHRDVYAAVVGCWNERVEAAVAGTCIGVLDYYDFLMNVYSRLEPVDRILSADERHLIAEHWNDYHREHGNPLLIAESAAETGPLAPLPAHLASLASNIDAFRPQSPNSRAMVEPVELAPGASPLARELRAASC